MNALRRSTADEQIVLRLIENVVNNGDFELIDEIVHPDFFDHQAPARRATGTHGFRETIREIREANAVFRMDPKDVMVDDGKVVVRASVSGRSRSHQSTTPQVGGEWSTQEIHIYRIAEQMVIEHWATQNPAATPQLGRLKETHP
jgi:predicted SnoaL-like aldol condensation-catalyzing enzyme